MKQFKPGLTFSGLVTTKQCDTPANKDIYLENHL